MGNTKSNVGSPSPRSKLFHELILKSWWTILILLVCTFAYDQATRRRDREAQRLRTKRAHLKQQLASAQAETIHLERRLASQDDSDWLELVLKSKLGLVSEGETKVHLKR